MLLVYICFSKKNGFFCLIYGAQLIFTKSDSLQRFTFTMKNHLHVLSLFTFHLFFSWISINQTMALNSLRGRKGKRQISYIKPKNLALYFRFWKLFLLNVSVVHLRMLINREFIAIVFSLFWFKRYMFKSLDRTSNIMHVLILDPLKMMWMKHLVIFKQKCWQCHNFLLKADSR